jgi:hypothetical protein
MRTIITLSSLGLTLALSGAALAAPANRSADRTGYASEQLQNHYRHKRYYRHDQDRARGEGSGMSRLQDGRGRDGVGTARPQVRKPALRPEPAVLRGPVGRERPQIA